MLESVPFILCLSTVLGFLSGLGIGGGSLLILWLTLVLGWEHSVARGANLLFFLPAAIVSSILRWRQGNLHWKKVWPAIAAGCVAAAFFTWLSGMLHLELLRKLFGGLLILTGIRELLWKPKNNGDTSHS